MSNQQTESMTPNCKLCKWKGSLFFTAICKSQGFQSCSEVYNEIECQELYELKKTKGECQCQNQEQKK